MDNNTSIKQVIAEFKQAFGEIEYKAVQAGTGLTVQSKGWIEPPTPRLEILGDDYQRLGNLSATNLPRKGVISGMLNLMKGKK